MSLQAIGNIRVGSHDKSQHFLIQLNSRGHFASKAGAEEASRQSLRSRDHHSASEELMGNC